MLQEKKCALSVELSELYDIRTKKEKREKFLTQQVIDAKNDIKNVTIVFSDGITDVSVQMNEQEYLEWDSRAKRLVYHKGDHVQFIEGVRSDILIRLRPYLRELVKKAQQFYL